MHSRGNRGTHEVMVCVLIRTGRIGHQERPASAQLVDRGSCRVVLQRRYARSRTTQIEIPCDALATGDVTTGNDYVEVRRFDQAAQQTAAKFTCATDKKDLLHQSVRGRSVRNRTATDGSGVMQIAICPNQR